jgi:choline dehydrogenase-like flavoprotein
MHSDCRILPDKSIIEGDLCIIGAGAAGISMALDWDGRREKVILLEGGGFEYEDTVQQSYNGTTTGQNYYPLKAARLHYFGGTTGHWAGMCSPFDPIDFKKRDWVPHSGWPIDKADLDPYYIKAHLPLQLGPYPYSYEFWKDELANSQQLPFDPKVVWNKMWQYSNARFGSLYRETLVNSSNIHLYTYAKVVELIANEPVNEINEVRLQMLDGKQHRVRAKRFVMACGARQNARLLLASDRQAKAGLGNEYDLVGRYFQEHLEIASAEFWLFKPLPMGLYTYTYNKTRSNAELALTEDIQRENKILNGTVSFMPLRIGKYRIPKIQTYQDEDPRKAWDNMSEHYGETLEKAREVENGPIKWSFELNTRIEQTPNPESRISLESETDAFGLRRVKLHWALSALDKRSIRRLYELLGQQAGISGLGRIRLYEWLQDEKDMGFPDSTNAGWHHMGTTRMSNNPKTGVVDANCKVHGIANLYVAGSACYPTSGAPNPTLTLVALALRLSDHLKISPPPH